MDVSAQGTVVRRSATAVSLLGMALSAAVFGLVVWTLLPATFGWSPTVVLTGSMRPAINPGDVVVVAPVPDKGLTPGYVIRFRDPAEPDRYLVHRVLRLNPDGTIVTKGDANQSEDSTPVALDEVSGMARLRVPYVGLPAIWLREHRYVTLAGAFAALVVALTGASAGWRRPGAAPRHRRR